MRNIATAVYRPKNGATQSVTIGAASARTTNPVGSQTYEVALQATAACHVNFGSSSNSATTSDQRLPADVMVAFSISPGEHVAVIQDAGAGTGTLYVSELTH